MHIIDSFSTMFTLSAAAKLLPVIGWHNVVVTTNVASSSAAVNYPITNVANPATHLIWRGNVVTANEVITITTNYADDVDYVAIARHNFGSAGIGIIIDGVGVGNSPGGFVELIGLTFLEDDSPVIFRFESHPWQTIRITLLPGTANPELAVLYCGKLTTFERSVKIDARHTPFQLGQVSKQVTAKSESGHFLGRVVLSRKAASIADFEHIDQTWYRDNLQPVVEGAQEDPFFFAWDPSEYSDDVGYAWLVDDAKPEIDPVTRRVAIQLKMEGLIR